MSGAKRMGSASALPIFLSLFVGVRESLQRTFTRMDM